MTSVADGNSDSSVGDLDIQNAMGFLDEAERDLLRCMRAAWDEYFVLSYSEGVKTGYSEGLLEVMRERAIGRAFGLTLALGYLWENGKHIRDILTDEKPWGEVQDD